MVCSDSALLSLLYDSGLLHFPELSPLSEILNLLKFHGAVNLSLYIASLLLYDLRSECAHDAGHDDHAFNGLIPAHLHVLLSLLLPVLPGSLVLRLHLHLQPYSNREGCDKLFSPHLATEWASSMEIDAAASLGKG